MVDLEIPIAMHGFEESAEGPFGDPRLGLEPIPPWGPGEIRHYVIQFTHSLFEEERLDVQQRFDLELEAYIPKFAYVERVDEETVEALKLEPIVNGLFPLNAVSKVSPGIGTIVFRDPDRAGMEGFRLWMTLFSDEQLNTILQLLQQANATDIVILDDREEEDGDSVAAGAAVLRIAFTIESLDPLQEIAALDSVNWIEEVPEAIADGGIPSGWMQTGSAAVDITDAGLTGVTEVVGVLDEGLLGVEHCWFRDSGHATPGSLHRKMVARHGSANGAPTHAAFVAGILCGEDLASPARRGVAYKAKMVYGNRDDFNDSAATATFYQFLKLLRTGKAAVINNSWHSNANPSYSSDSVTTDSFMWRNESILLVGSAANTGETMGAPGTTKNALSVGAAYIDESGNCLGDVGFGTERKGMMLTGKVEGGRDKPDLLVPGCDIESANLDGAATPCGIISDADFVLGADPPRDPVCDPEGPDHAKTYCFSSFATPVASAAAAIVRQYFMQGWHVTGNPGSPPHRPTAALLKAMLLNATQQLTQPPITDYPVIGEGWGVLQLDRVLRLPGEARKIVFWDFPNAAGFFRRATPRDPHEVTVNSNSQHLKITLVWTEPPGDLKSKDPVVNNLDLVAISPSGARFTGNAFFSGQSEPAGPLALGKPDAANNVEMVLVKQPEPGPWQISVLTTEVNAGRNGQGYALVVRGDLA